MMRMSALTIAAGIAGPWSFTAEAWEEYENEAFGYAVSFPAAPSERTGVYGTRILPNANVHYLFLEDETNIYSAAVVETEKVDGTSIIGEADYNLSMLGDTVLNNVSRLTGTMDHGRFITIDCREDFVPEVGGGDLAFAIRNREMLSAAMGIECPTDARLTANLFFKNGLLYLIMGVNKPGPNARISINAGRFANSIGWIDAHGDSEEPTDLVPLPAGTQ